VDTVLKGRSDRPLEVIEARRRKQESLREGAERLGATAQDGVPDLLGSLRPSRLPRDQHLMTDSLDPAAKTFDLR
jgi:hypothetical protein